MLSRVLQFIHRKKWQKTTLAMFLIVCSFLLGSTVFAQNVDPLGVTQAGTNLGLSSLSPSIIIARIINAILAILAVIIVIYMIYAGALWMTAAGKEDQIEKAKKTLINAVIGLIIVLSSWGITRFVLQKLLESTGLGANGENGQGRIPSESFVASGSLGRIVKDHYPFRNQTEVKRNTRIVVTFAAPILPSSTIQNTNKSCWNDALQPTTDNQVCDPDGDGVLNRAPYYGDCHQINGVSVCDELATSSVKIFPTGDEERLVEAFAFTTYDNNAQATTFVFQPKEALGNDATSVNYTVQLTNNVLLQTGTPAFAGDRDGRYEWVFETNTEFDTDPPVVQSVYPRNGQVVPRNSIVKITFNEPIDPTTVQGLVGPNTLFNTIVFGSNAPIEGEWKISNGYQTVEFVSQVPCGQNSCGDTMYCLPLLCNDPQDVACQNTVDTLVLTALSEEPDNARSFISIPFTGVADMSSNRMDGNADGQAQARPAVNNPKAIDDGEKAPDNYWWSFVVANTIDRVPPHIESVMPLLDQERVEAFTPVHIRFSKEMWNDTLYDIDITEHPQELRDQLNIPELWKRPRGADQNGKTIATVDHREFGPLGEAFYYFPSIPGSVKSVTQNCLYPGRGPVYKEIGQGDQVPICEVLYDDRGNAIGDGNNCVPVRASEPKQDTGCARRVAANDDSLTQPDTETCINFLSDPAISPR